MAKVSVILVTYNCPDYLEKAIGCLNAQSHQADQIIIVDTGSRDSGYLFSYHQYPNVSVHFAEKESGFCKGNNVGWTKVAPDADYVFLLNPDAFLTSDYLKNAVDFMEDSYHADCGAITGMTLGYDLKKNHPTGKYDSTGIFRTWYGKWYDRGQGMDVCPDLFANQEELPGICGAVFFCRKKALDQVLIRGTELLDSTFYMYKEDIDLSIRLRKKKWKLFYVPKLVAYHCRGWNPDRSKMSRKVRLCSAKNEFRIQFKNGCLPGLLYSGLKFSAVKLFDF